MADFMATGCLNLRPGHVVHFGGVEQYKPPLTAVARPEPAGLPMLLTLRSCSHPFGLEDPLFSSPDRSCRCAFKSTKHVRVAQVCQACVGGGLHWWLQLTTSEGARRLDRATISARDHMEEPLLAHDIECQKISDHAGGSRVSAKHLLG